MQVCVIPLMSIIIRRMCLGYVLDKNNEALSLIRMLLSDVSRS